MVGVAQLHPNKLLDCLGVPVLTHNQKDEEKDMSADHHI